MFNFHYYCHFSHEAQRLVYEALACVAPCGKPMLYEPLLATDVISLISIDCQANI